jgi:hypothetical protein
MNGDQDQHKVFTRSGTGTGNGTVKKINPDRDHCKNFTGTGNGTVKKINPDRDHCKNFTGTGTGTVKKINPDRDHCKNFTGTGTGTVKKINPDRDHCKNFTGTGTRPKKSDFAVPYTGVKGLRECISKIFFVVDLEGNAPGDFMIHWPPLFPNLWLPECDMMQLDVVIRSEVRIFL